MSDAKNNEPQPIDEEVVDKPRKIVGFTWNPSSNKIDFEKAMETMKMKEHDIQLMLIKETGVVALTVMQDGEEVIYMPGDKVRYSVDEDKYLPSDRNAE